MKNIYKLLHVGVLFTISSFCFANTSPKDQKFKDLHKKTAQGFIVPYKLRYNPEDWSCRYTDGMEQLTSLKNKSLQLVIFANKEEKNCTQEYFDNDLKGVLEDLVLDSSLYKGFEINSSKFITINGINFLHQNAVIHLAPNSIHYQPLEKKGQFRKRYISEKGGYCQRNYYTYSGDQGCITFVFKSDDVLNQEDQATIDELFRGFSFDGSACRGPSKLRALKSVFEAVTDQLSQ